MVRKVKARTLRLPDVCAEMVESASTIRLNRWSCHRLQRQYACILAKDPAIIPRGRGVKYPKGWREKRRRKKTSKRMSPMGRTFTNVIKVMTKKNCNPDGLAKEVNKVFGKQD